MILANFVISLFYRKRETKEKEKGLHGLGQAHNEAGPTTRIQPRSKKKPTRRGPLRSGTLVYFKNY
jgi:hypothetical protein